jgi:hypothetical protein
MHRQSIRARAVATLSVAAAAAGFAANATFARDPQVRSEAPPVCVHGGPYTGECAGIVTSVPLDASASYDPDGTPVSFRWSSECIWGHFDDVTNPRANFVFEITDGCSKWCEIRVRVTSGGQSVTCGTLLTVQDTTPPALTCPPDVTDIWGIPTDPGSTGVATAFDVCHDPPVVGSYDTIIPQLGPGHEQTILRTWVATDLCGLSTQAVQTITLLSPATNCKSLEMDLTTCPDVLDRTSPAALRVHVLGRPGSAGVTLNRATLKLARLGDQVNFVYPFATYTPLDVGRFLAVDYGDCNVPGTDGRADVMLDFDRASVVAALGLGALPPGAKVWVMVTGLRNNGTPYFAANEMYVQ